MARLFCSSRRVLAALLWSTLIMAAGACEGERPSLALDTLAPTTSLEETVLSGTTRGAATVEIYRLSPSAAQTDWSVPVSEYDGRWRHQVSLVPSAVNEFIAFPIDAEGRRGEGVAFSLVHEAVRAHAISLVLDPDETTTSAGAVQARITVSHPEAVDLRGLPVEILLESPLSEPKLLLETDSLGNATALVEGLYQLGEVLVIARSGAVFAEGVVQVTRDPFAAASIEVFLDAGAAGETIGGEYHVSAGTEVEVRATVRDAFGEVIEGAVFDIESSVPGSRVENGRLVGLTTAGSFLVVAAVRGSAVWGGAQLVVLPGEPADLRLTLSHTNVLVGEPLRFRLGLFDVHGNPTEDGSAIEVVGGAHAVVTRENDLSGTIVFELAGNMEVVASAGESLLVRRDVRVGELGDAGASVRLLDPLHGEILPGGSTIALRVRAEAAAGVAEILLDVADGDGGGTAYRSPIPGAPFSVEQTFDYQVPSTVHVLHLTATLIDRQGRRVTDRTRSVLIHPTIVVAEGYELRYVAGGPISGFSRPTGIQLLDANTALVTNFAAQDVVSVDLQTGRISPFASLPGFPRDIVRDPATGHLIVSLNDDRLARLDDSGGLLTATWAHVTAAWGMAVDEDGLVFVASGSTRHLVALPASQTQSATASFILGCGGSFPGDIRGVAIAPSAAGKRSLLVTSSSPSSLYRCESDPDGGTEEGRFLGADLLGLARYVVALDATSALVTNELDDVVVRLSENPDDPAGAWNSEVVATGFDYPSGLAVIEPGRVLLTIVDDHLLLELRHP